jgi:hypothetical protein
MRAGPTILETSDLEKITGSSKLFARKFDVTRDTHVIDAIDDLTNNR